MASQSQKLRREITTAKNGLFSAMLPKSPLALQAFQSGFLNGRHRVRFPG